MQAHLSNNFVQNPHEYKRESERKEQRGCLGVFLFIQAASMRRNLHSRPRNSQAILLSQDCGDGSKHAHTREYISPP
jgi:hypothetical protein